MILHGNLCGTYGLAVQVADVMSDERLDEEWLPALKQQIMEAVVALKNAASLAPAGNGNAGSAFASLKDDLSRRLADAQAPLAALPDHLLNKAMSSAMDAVGCLRTAMQLFPAALHSLLLIAW